MQYANAGSSCRRELGTENHFSNINAEDEANSAGDKLDITGLSQQNKCWESEINSAGDMENLTEHLDKVIPCWGI